MSCFDTKVRSLRCIQSVQRTLWTIASPKTERSGSRSRLVAVWRVRVFCLNLNYRVLNALHGTTLSTDTTARLVPVTAVSRIYLGSGSCSWMPCDAQSCFMLSTLKSGCSRTPRGFAPHREAGLVELAFGHLLEHQGSVADQVYRKRRCRWPPDAVAARRSPL